MDNARVWLFAVARNTLIDPLRLRKDQVELPEVRQAPHEEPVPVDTQAACLSWVLAELSADDREALTLCDLEGLTQNAYAQLKGLTLPGAKSRVQGARKRLREQLSNICQVRLDDTGQVSCFVTRLPLDTHL
jgi:RNA polymerase sigma-70 factor (ECF subfamily)